MRHGLEKTVTFAARKVGPSGRILIIIDADDDCPATLGPELLQRVQEARPDRQISVVLAKSEFESWFLAGTRMRRGGKQMRPGFDPTGDN